MSLSLFYFIAYALCLYLCLIPVICTGQAEARDPEYLRLLLAQARDKKLADARVWHLLLHYKPRLVGGVKSEADGKGFFFHPRGKVDPHEELEATLRAFFLEESEQVKDEEWQHPQCRFPARYHWLKRQLGFDLHRLPERACPRFDQWRQALDPGSISLIFASYYMSNPASMFGHTLLRLNRKEQQGAPKLLDYGVNYAATPTTRNGILYALLGIVGGFKGQFANFPYYLKVQEGLVDDVVYRPSILSQFTQKRQAMTSRESALLQKIFQTKSLFSLESFGLDAHREALVLDAALDLAQYHNMKKRDKLAPEDNVFQRELLIRRSQFGIANPSLPQEPLSTRPELGHGTFRLRLATGINDDDLAFVELSFPSFHDLLDPDEGFPPYSHIQLLTLTLRYYLDSERLDVEQWDLVRITSLSPHDAFVKKPSWRVEVGYQTLRDLDCGRCHWFKVAGGTGRAVRLNRSVSSLAYAFFNLEAGLSEAFDASFRLAPGVMAGVMFQPFYLWKVHISGSVYYPVLGGSTVYYRNFVHQHIAFIRQIGVRLEMNYFKTTLEGLVALHIYF